MQVSYRYSTLLLPFAAACAATPELVHPTLEPSPVVVRVMPVQDDGPVVDLDIPAPIVRPVSVRDLELWRSESFKDDFARGLVAVSDVEPNVLSQEQDVLGKVQLMLENDAYDRAVALLDRFRSVGTSPILEFTRGFLYMKAPNPFEVVDDPATDDVEGGPAEGQEEQYEAFEKEKFENAKQVLTNAAEGDKRFLRAWRFLGIAAITLEDFAEARRAFSKVLELGGGDPTVYGSLGYACAQLNDPIGAETAYRMALLLKPGDKDFQQGLLGAFFNQGRYAESAAVAGMLLEEDQSNVKLWLAQANSYVRMGDYQKAGQNYFIVDQMGGSTSDTLLALGDIYISDGLFDMGVDAHLRALGMNGEVSTERAMRATKNLVVLNAVEASHRMISGIENVAGERLDDRVQRDLFNYRAKLALAAGERETEIAALEQMVELDPLDGHTLLLLARYEADRGNNDRARVHYERAGNIQEFAPDAYAGLGSLSAKEKNFDEAKRHLKASLDLRPNERVRRFLDWVESNSR